MFKKIIPFVVVVAILGGFFSWCYSIRETPESRRAARKAVAKELRETAPEGVLAYLEKLSAEKSFQTAFDGKAPLMAFRTRVPHDFIGQLTEDQFIRFAGDGAAKQTDLVRMKELLAFSAKLLASGDLSDVAANSLRERRLDGYFLTNDFDGAITLLEKEGLPKRSPGWCKGTAAKLRAHKAMSAKDNKEAIKQLLIFGEFMLSDEQKDFEDCDPTTGILYSREWVVARNYMRCSNLSKDLGDTVKVAEYFDLAKKYFSTALEKAKEDEKSLAVLKEEMKSAGL